jgi:hypothetical protein
VSQELAHRLALAAASGSGQGGILSVFDALVRGNCIHARAVLSVVVMGSSR